jgi:hypothetical protein
MLAGECAFVFAHQGARFFCNRTHPGRAVAAHVENGAHVQRADRRVRVPRAAGTVLAEYLRQAVDIVRQML